MKALFCILVVLGIGCQQKPSAGDAGGSVREDSGSNKINELSDYYTTQDTVRIDRGRHDSLVLSKSEFNSIVDEHPELLHTDYVRDPDDIYFCNGAVGRFGSEAGQDAYYSMYAYFLAPKNPGDSLKVCRETLTEIYLTLNSLFGYIQYGGTYFGHQAARIPGYAEYSVSIFKGIGDGKEKHYDFTPAKKNYIASLRQLVKDEISIDNTTQEGQKEGRYGELFGFVNRLDSLINTDFYLKRAKSFHYSKYEYY